MLGISVPNLREEPHDMLASHSLCDSPNLSDPSIMYRHDPDDSRHSLSAAICALPAGNHFRSTIAREDPIIPTLAEQYQSFMVCSTSENWTEVMFREFCILRLLQPRCNTKHMITIEHIANHICYWFLYDCADYWPASFFMYHTTSHVHFPAIYYH